MVQVVLVTLGALRVSFLLVLLVVFSFCSWDVDRQRVLFITETLASILNRSTSLLPTALFASLGMPQGDGNWGDARHVRIFFTFPSWNSYTHLPLVINRALIKSLKLRVRM